MQVRERRCEKTSIVERRVACVAREAWARRTARAVVRREGCRREGSRGWAGDAGDARDD